MFSKLISLAGAAFGSVIAGHHASNAATWQPTSYQLNVDNSTYANADQIHTTHYHVDWQVSFDDKVIYGSITHDLEVLQDTTQLVLDSWLINVESAELLPAESAISRIRDPSVEQTGEALNWSIVEVNPILGSALVIKFNSVLTAGSFVSVRVHYHTSPSAQAFSWMDPSQTAGKVLPYMYTQCEDINCRTVAPI